MRRPPSPSESPQWLTAMRCTVPGKSGCFMHSNFRSTAIFFFARLVVSVLDWRRSHGGLATACPSVSQGLDRPDLRNLHGQLQLNGAGLWVASGTGMTTGVREQSPQARQHHPPRARYDHHSKPIFCIPESYQPRGICRSQMTVVLRH